jgi:hypothetical protein
MTPCKAYASTTQQLLQSTQHVLPTRYAITNNIYMTCMCPVRPGMQPTKCQTISRVPVATKMTKSKNTKMPRASRPQGTEIERFRFLRYSTVYSTSTRTVSRRVEIARKTQGIFKQSCLTTPYISQVEDVCAYNEQTTQSIISDENYGVLNNGCRHI